MSRHELTAARLRDVLDYEPLTGVFRWKVRVSTHVYPGDVAGTDKGGGYIVIALDGIRHYAHRLAWLYTHGVWPESGLDHKDTDPSNNAIGNLRPATETQNHANTPRRADNVSGFKGASWHRTSKRWRAQIQLGNRKIHLGVFKAPEEAHAAYVAAANIHFGEYARAG